MIYERQHEVLLCNLFLIIFKENVRVTNFFFPQIDNMASG